MDILKHYGFVVGGTPNRTQNTVARDFLVVVEQSPEGAGIITDEARGEAEPSSSSYNQAEQASSSSSVVPTTTTTVASVGPAMRTTRVTEV